MNSNNTMLQSSNFRNNQSGPNNFNMQNSNSNINLAQSQYIPKNQNIKKLRVQMTKDEQMLYSKLYNMLDNNGLGRILAKNAANFMKSSNLKKEVLKEIWLIAAQESNTYLLREEFYIAMRLIALAQNNMPFSAQNIEMNSPIPPLPNFNFNNNNQNNNDNNQSNNFNNNQSNNFNNNQNIYEISEKEKIFLKKIFDNKKEPNVERITAHNSIIFWKSNNADDNAIRTVASIIKPLENKGFFNLKEFQVACHLISLSKKMPLPQKLPDTLINYLGRNNNNFNHNNFNDYSNSRMNTNTNMTQFFTNNNSNLNDSNFTIQSKQLSNSPFTNNNNLDSNNKIDNGDNRIQELLRKEEDLTKKSNILNIQINSAKDKINDLLKEIELIQKRQDNINSELNLLRQECNNLRNNGNSNIMANKNNLISKNNDKSLSAKNSSNPLSNSLIKKNLENIGKNMRYDTSDLNSNNELNTNKTNNNNNFGTQSNKNEAYPSLENKKPDIMDLMNNMNLSPNNNDFNTNNNINNGNNNFSNNNFNNNGSNNNLNDNQSNYKNMEKDQTENKQNEQKYNMDFDLEDNLKIEEKEVVNPYEIEGDNKNENKNEDNGSNQKNGDDEWDF